MYDAPGSDSLNEFVGLCNSSAAISVELTNCTIPYRFISTN